VLGPRHDVSDCLKVARALVEKLGLVARLAESGEEALLALAHPSPVDLVLLDLHMPGIDGFETTRRLRAQGFIRPIVALTANVLPEIAAQCRAVGMNGYLSKPVQLKELRCTLAEFLPSMRAPTG